MDGCCEQRVARRDFHQPSRIHHQNSMAQMPHDGEIVVALVDETYATLKRLFKHGAEVELRPSNSQLESIRVPARNVRVQGIFRGLLRQAKNN